MKKGQISSDAIHFSLLIYFLILIISYRFWNEHYPLRELPKAKVVSEANFKAIHRRQDWFLMDEGELKIKFSCSDIGKTTCERIYSDPNFLAKDIVYVVFPETCAKYRAYQNVSGNCEGMLLQGNFYIPMREEVVNFTASEMELVEMLKRKRFRDNFIYPILIFLVSLFLVHFYSRKKFPLKDKENDL